MTPLMAVLIAITSVLQITSACKNCIVMGKEEKAMFRAHSDDCLPQSRVAPALVETLLGGELVEDAALKAHVYCVLLRCKIIGKDGKLIKSTMVGKIGSRAEAKNATKILENCAKQMGDTPEELAWSLFKCGFDKKALLFHYMPAEGAPAGDLDNNSN